MKNTYIVLVAFLLSIQVSAQSKYTGGSGSGYSSATASYTAPLPVNLLNYSAKVKSGQVHIEWSLATNEPSNVYILETSVDEHKYILLTSIQYNIDNSSLMKHAYIDETYQGGQLYYRLSEISIDGTKKELGIRRVNAPINSPAAITISPNPADAFVRITMELGAAPISYKIYSSEGSLVLCGTTSNDGIISLQDLAAGVYFMSFPDQSISYKKILISR
jgi:hypothetical protein